MYAIYLGSKHQLRHLQALLSSIRTRPISDKWDEWQALYHSQIKRRDETESADITWHKIIQIAENQENDPRRD
jgi:hypothetical protein